MPRSLCAETLFSSLDTENKGWVSTETLIQSCGLSLTKEDKEHLVNELDPDKDGRISLEDFKKGFSVLLKPSKNHVESITPKYSRRPCLTKNDLKDLKEILYDVRGSKELLDLTIKVSEKIPEAFCLIEKASKDIANQVKEIKEEKSIVDEELERIRLQHCEDMKRLAIELDNQIASAEYAARGEGRLEAEKEFSLMLSMRETEIGELTQKLDELESKYSKSSSSGEFCDPHDSQVRRLSRRKGSILTSTTISELRDQLSKVEQEKRSTELDLATMRTQFLLTKTALATLKQSSEKMEQELKGYIESSAAWKSEEAHLKHQIEMLHEVNLNLRDANDELRAALDQSSVDVSRHKDSFASAATLLSRVDFENNMKDLNRFTREAHNNYSPLGNQEIEERRENLSKTFIGNTLHPIDKTPFQKMSQDSACEDSGLSSSLREITDLESEIDVADSVVLDPNRSHARQSFDMNSRFSEQRNLTRSPNQSKLNSSIMTLTSSHPYGSDLSNEEHPNQFQARNSKPEKLLINPQNFPERPSNVLSLRNFSSPSSHGSSQVNLYNHRTSTNQDIFIPQSMTDQCQMQISQPRPTQIYRIMLAGDSAVGKTSFIFRLCHNQFHTETMSTISIDVKRKTFQLDNEEIILELWDTAGQERFQSLTKSFYRKADGVLLLYDCTHESSFVNVRNWINSIQDNSNDDTPIFLVGNKTDLRDLRRAQNRPVIEYEDGKRLAQENNVCFVETSARDGINIENCALSLARFVRTRQSILIRDQKNWTNLDPNNNPGDKLKSFACCKT